MKTFAAFVLPDLAGSVVVHDRYQNYDAFPGLAHQLCAAHILRDFAGAAETCPAAHWPVQITQVLPGLIHAANTARGQGLDAVPQDIAAPLEHAFRHGVILACPRFPPAARTGRCWNACATAATTSCASPRTCEYRQPPTRPIMRSSGLCRHGAGCPGTRARPAWRGQHKYSGCRQEALSDARDGDVVK
jgi:hypothetical protein